MPKKLLIVAGEASGDFHGASLVRALKRLDPEISCCGIGGQRMALAGCKIFIDIAELAFLGFIDVLINYSKIKKIFTRLLAYIEETQPDAVILIDYPGFNLKLAQELKKRKFRVIYYISPQIWAWWPGRIETIRRSVEKMLVIFKFEEELYAQHGINAAFVGHPLLDIARPEHTKEEYLHILRLSEQNLTVGLMPGSRAMEVKRILPLLLQSARIIKEKLWRVQFVILKTPELPKELYTAILEKSSLEARISENRTYDFLNICDFALVASGTATLETAIMTKPMIIVYKVSFLNWLIARSLIKLPYIGLVNVVAGKKIIPEFVQFQAQPQRIATAALEMLQDQPYLTKVKQELEKVRAELGEPGASARAAEIITRLLS
ncbi:MAG: lipid-A-disaccharide synthase [Candidatus Omnitrophota bacterium]